MSATIGTCATALLANLGTNRDGKRVAVAHLIFSVSAALVVWPFMGPLCHLTNVVTVWMGSTSPARAIAMATRTTAGMANAFLLKPSEEDTARLEGRSVKHFILRFARFSTYRMWRAGGQGVLF